jgi:hypothetical protein
MGLFSFLNALVRSSHLAQWKLLRWVAEAVTPYTPDSLLFLPARVKLAHHSLLSFSTR